MALSVGMAVMAIWMMVHNSDLSWFAVLVYALLNLNEEHLRSRG